MKSKKQYFQYYTAEIIKTVDVESFTTTAIKAMPCFIYAGTSLSYEVGVQQSFKKL